MPAEAIDLPQQEFDMEEIKMEPEERANDLIDDLDESFEMERLSEEDLENVAGGWDGDDGSG